MMEQNIENAGISQVAMVFKDVDALVADARVHVGRVRKKCVCNLEESGFKAWKELISLVRPEDWYE